MAGRADLDRLSGRGRSRRGRCHRRNKHQVDDTHLGDTHFVSIGAGEPQGMRTVNPKACPIVPATGAYDGGRSDRGISARAI
jgi:hypothetical protein